LFGDNGSSGKGNRSIKKHDKTANRKIVREPRESNGTKENLTSQKNFDDKIAEKSEKESQDQLEKYVAMLMNRGHQNVWDYSYSFFKNCLFELEKEQKVQIASMCAAIGLAFSGKKEEIEKFLEG